MGVKCNNTILPLKTSHFSTCHPFSPLKCGTRFTLKWLWEPSGSGLEPLVQMVFYGFLSAWDPDLKSALHPSILSLLLSLSILLFRHLSPPPISSPPAAVLQTSCASTAFSTMRTCRRSPSTLWFAMSTPQDSRLERPSCLRGRKHAKTQQ